MNLALAIDTPMAVAPEHGSKTAEEAVYEALSFMREAWSLSGSALAEFLRLPASTVNTWFAKKRVPLGKPPFDPTAEAILHLIAVHRSLDAMFSGPEGQRAWLDTPHPAFERAPADLMRDSLAGLIFIRQYLDYTRGRGA